MVFIDLLLAFFVALMCSALLARLLRRMSGGEAASWSVALLVPFLILFLAVWAGGVWMTPAAPAVWGVNWLGFVLIGLVVTLIMAAAIPRRTPRTQWEVSAQAERQLVAGWAFSIFFWLLLVSLAVLILAHYVPLTM